VPPPLPSEDDTRPDGVNGVDAPRIRDP